MKKLGRLLVPISLILVIAVMPTVSASVNQSWSLFTNTNFSNGCQGWNLSSSGSPSSATCTNSYTEWDTNTQVTLSQTTHLAPILVWDPNIAMMIMAWFGTDSIGQLNVIRSSDMVNWADQVHWGAPGTSSDTSNQQLSMDLTYDSDNQKVYLAYLIDDISGLCPTCTNSYQLWVQSSSDGKIWSSPVEVASESVDGKSSTVGPWAASITYDNSHHQFEMALFGFNIANNPVQDILAYTSTDGVGWSGPQIVYYNNNPVLTAITGSGVIRFLNGNYYLVYTGSSSSIPISFLLSADGNTWTSQVTTSFAGYDGIIAYDSAEGLYHLTWASCYTGSTQPCGLDSTSSDASSWGAPSTIPCGGCFATFGYDSNAQVLLAGWAAGSAGTINVMQYHRITTGTTAFQSQVSCNGCSYAGSFAQQSGSVPFSSNYVHTYCNQYSGGQCTVLITTGYSYTFFVGFSLAHFAQVGGSGSWFNYGLSLYVSWSGPVGKCGFSTMQVIFDLKDNGGVNTATCDNTRHLYFYEVAIDQSNGNPALTPQGYDVTMNVHNALAVWNLPDGGITSGAVESQTNGYEVTVVYGYAQLSASFTNACYGSGCGPQACRPNPCPQVITKTN